MNDPFCLRTSTSSTSGSGVVDRSRFNLSTRGVVDLFHFDLDPNQTLKKIFIIFSFKYYNTQTQKFLIFVYFFMSFLFICYEQKSDFLKKEYVILVILVDFYVIQIRADPNPQNCFTAGLCGFVLCNMCFPLLTLFFSFYSVFFLLLSSF